MLVHVHLHADLCAQGGVVLASSDTNGTVVTFVNTTSHQTSEITIPYRYVPTSETCGQRFEMCSQISLTSENRTVAVLSLNDSVGLVLRNGENDSGNDSLQWHTVSPEDLEACIFIGFVPVPTVTNLVVGYCIKLGILYTFDITFSYTSLDLSRIQPRVIGDMHPLGISANRTNFVNFDNNPGDNCFSTELPYVFFLVDNTLVEHSFGDGFTTLGTILSSATCTKLQRIGECQLAIYCGREIYTFSVHDNDRENFAPTPVPLTSNGGLVFICSSSYLVYLRNSSLALYDRNTLSPLGDPIYTQLDEEDIVRGDCYGSEIESTTFVVTLYGTNSSLFLYRVTLVQQDSSTTTVNITNITPTSTDGGYVGSDIVIAQTGSQYAFVSDGTNTTILNWMLPCNESPWVIQSASTFVSFFTTGSTYQCRCFSSTMSTNPTIPTTISSITPNPTTSSLTTGSSPSSDSPGDLTNSIDVSLVLSIISILLVVALIVIIVIIAIIYILRKK